MHLTAPKQEEKMIGVDTVKQDGETVHTLYADETLNFCFLKSLEKSSAVAREKHAAVRCP